MATDKSARTSGNILNQTRKHVWFHLRYRPSHRKPKIELRLSLYFRARTKLHFCMFHVLISVPEKTFFLVVHKHVPARMR